MPEVSLCAVSAGGVGGVEPASETGAAPARSAGDGFRDGLIPSS